MSKPATSPSPREELLKMQKQIFRRNQRLIEESISVQERGFEEYQRNYQRRVSKFDHVSDLNELKKALGEADIIYVGDYHTNAQSQRAFLRILKMMIDLTRLFQVALELIHARFQPTIDQYLAGEIDEELFLKKLRLKRRWYID